MCIRDSLLREQWRSSGCRTSRDLTTRICAATTVCVHPGVDRIAQDVRDHLAMRTSPHELPDVRARPEANSDLDLVSCELVQQALLRADSIKRVEDQTHDLAHFLVGIEDNFTGLSTEVS